jgi:hypothetical protein
MKVSQLVPVERERNLDEIIEQSSAPGYEPFSPEIISVCTRFSELIFADSEARQFGELQALAFFMRKSALFQLREQFLKLKDENCVLVPRGLVFHIPPANVDTIFVYSWLLSVLSGNRNIIRLSPRRSQQTTILCRLLNASLSGAEEPIKSSTTAISYEHEESITEAISLKADVRVIWGGDATIQTIRKIPLAPHAKELVFPNRYSFAVIEANSYLQLDQEASESLAHKFFNDSYWFNQLACSSPRLLVFCGSTSATEKASARFWPELKKQIQQSGYDLPANLALAKKTNLHRAVLDEPVSSCTLQENELALLELKSLEKLSRQHTGLGMFYQYATKNLQDLVPFVQRCDQTLTHYGFSKSDLINLAKSLNGRGINRIVPIGQALSFARFWDGYDLLHEFLQDVFLSTES